MAGHSGHWTPRNPRLAAEVEESVESVANTLEPAGWPTRAMRRRSDHARRNRSARSTFHSLRATDVTDCTASRCIHLARFDALPCEQTTPPRTLLSGTVGGTHKLEDPRIVDASTHVQYARPQ